MEKTTAERQELQKLWLRYSQKRETSVRDRLIEKYSYLVRCIALKIAGHYQYFNYMDDIVSEGLIALMDAIERFNISKNVKFETYASIRIRGAMIDYIRKQDCFPRRLKRMAKDISSADDELNQELGRSPTDQELADYLHVSLEEYEKMAAETCSMNILSFEEIVYEKGVEDFTRRMNSTVAGPEQSMAKKELQNVLTENINRLDEKEKTVISLYYKEHLKIKEISEVLGISDSRVSQIHSSALKKLRAKVGAYLTQ